MVRMPGGWELSSNNVAPSLLNLKPVGDIKDHELTVHCWCRPRVEGVRQEETGRIVGSVTIHNAIDGRE